MPDAEHYPNPLQDQLPVGATIVPIILASDKTPVTRHTGGLEMHLVFMTIGNIQSDVRMQATSHAWRCVAFIPTTALEVHPDFKTLLLLCLFHHCMDIIFASLKDVAHNGAAMTDSLGYIRNCFTLSLPMSLIFPSNTSSHVLPRTLLP
jgi:hypothetical protein